MSETMNGADEKMKSSDQDFNWQLRNIFLNEKIVCPQPLFDAVATFSHQHPARWFHFINEDHDLVCELRPQRDVDKDGYLVLDGERIDSPCDETAKRKLRDALAPLVQLRFPALSAGWAQTHVRFEDGISVDTTIWRRGPLPTRSRKDKKQHEEDVSSAAQPGDYDTDAELEELEQELSTTMDDGLVPASWRTRPGPDPWNTVWFTYDCLKKRLPLQNMLLRSCGLFEAAKNVFCCVLPERGMISSVQKELAGANPLTSELFRPPSVLYVLHEDGFLFRNYRNPSHPYFRLGSMTVDHTSGGCWMQAQNFGRSFGTIDRSLVPLLRVTQAELDKAADAVDLS